MSTASLATTTVEGDQGEKDGPARGVGALVIGHLRIEKGV